MNGNRYCVGLPSGYSTATMAIHVVGGTVRATRDAKIGLEAPGALECERTGSHWRGGAVSQGGDYLRPNWYPGGLAIMMTVRHAFDIMRDGRRLRALNSGGLFAEHRAG